MKVLIKFSVLIDETDLPISFLDEAYFTEVIKENIEDVFLGSDVDDFTIEEITVDVRGNEI